VTSDYYLDRNILICGGAGFLGMHLTDALLSAGANVTIIDPCVPGTGGNPSNIEKFGNAVKWIREDVENTSALDQALSHCGLVFDCMGLTKHHEGIADPLHDLTLNYTSHIHLILGLGRTPRPVVYLGSRCQFGALRQDMDEDANQLPLDPQGIHKSAAEHAFRIYSKRTGFSALSVRLGNCFGPGQPTQGRDVGLVGGFVRALCKGERVTLYGLPGRGRNLVYAPDAASWLVQAATRMNLEFDTVNMLGEENELEKMLDALVRLIGKGAGSYHYQPFPANAANMDVGTAAFGNGRFTHYVPRPDPTDLETALGHTVAYFKKELHALAV